MPFNPSLAQKLKRPGTFRLWMLRHLPMGLLSGMYISSLDQQACTVVLKDRWWIRNPFGSVFWAVMGMAAELSTGALIYANASGSGVKFILTGMEARFHKKVRGKSFYLCTAGEIIIHKFAEVANTDEAIDISLPVEAKDVSGTLLAEFKFEWQIRRPKVD